MRSWIGGPWFDSAFILGPGAALAAFVACFPGFFQTHAVTTVVWGVLVLGVDVAHVYSTMYRTYFDPEEFRRRRMLYILAPSLGFLGFVVLYSLGAMVFWRVLAYLAVFHFVRQQYGLMMIYRRADPGPKWLDMAAIYAATLYPLLWWHCHGRHFTWFIDGDFFQLHAPVLANAVFPVYAAVLAAYAVREVSRRRHANIPASLLLASTAASWWVGIIALDSDLAFTATNILAHGIPYMALIWLYGRGQRRPLFTVRWLPLFAAVPIGLAWIEEGFWDGFIWTEHPVLFRPFTILPVIGDSDILVWLVPLLALPPITHYILDAFIWRSRTGWKQTLFGSMDNIGIGLDQRP